MSQTATVHYLDFDSGRDVRESIVFGDEVPSEVEFEEYYSEMGEVTIDSDSAEDLLSTVWKQWNRGSGYECDELLEITCDECGATFIEREENHSEIETHRSEHRARGHEVESLFSGTRSMMVGDIVSVDGDYYLCQPIGWEEITLEGGDGE